MSRRGRVVLAGEFPAQHLVRGPQVVQAGLAVLGGVAVQRVQDARDGLAPTGDVIHHDPHRKEEGRVEIWPLVEPPPAHPVSRPSSSEFSQISTTARIAPRSQDPAVDQNHEHAHGGREQQPYENTITIIHEMPPP